MGVGVGKRGVLSACLGGFVNLPTSFGGTFPHLLLRWPPCVVPLVFGEIPSYISLLI